MLDRDKQMQTGFVNFQNFTQSFGFASRGLFSRPGSFKNSTRWDVSRAATHCWPKISSSLVFSILREVTLPHDLFVPV